MAVNPLFSTRENLLKMIRMASAADAQTLAVVDMALTEIRLGFFSSLGADRAQQIAGYDTVENPATANEVTKATAMVAESLWLTAKLVEMLPVLFLADSAKVRDQFNDEPLTRDAASLARYKNSLMSRVEKMIGQLKSPVEAAGNFQVFDCGRVDEDGVDEPYLINENHIGNGW